MYEQKLMLSVEGMPPRSIAPSRKARIITIIVLLVALFYFLFPIDWLVVSSTKNNAGLITSNSLLFANNSIGKNYASLMAWSHGYHWRWVANSVLYSGTAAAAGTLLTVMAGYTIAKFNFPGRKAALAVIMLELLMPIALLTIAMYVLFQSIGLDNTVWAIIIPSCVSPFGVFFGTRLFTSIGCHRTH